MVATTANWSYAGNDPFFDAFAAEINGTLAVLWVIPIAMSGAHRGSEVGYQKVRQNRRL